MCDIIGESLSDEELVSQVKQGNSASLQTLIKRYMPIISAKAAKFCISADNDDFLQEGLVALYSAARVFDSDISGFSALANVCIDRALISYFRKNYRKKQIPSSALVSIDENIELSAGETPESVLIEKEECELLTENIKKKLSSREYKILLLYLAGNSYENIADKFKISVKTVNNSMYRARRKIELLK